MQQKNFFSPFKPVVKLQYALIIDNFMPYLDGLEKAISTSDSFEIHLDCVGSTGFYGEPFFNGKCTFVDPDIDMDAYTDSCVRSFSLDFSVGELTFCPKISQEFYCAYMSTPRNLALLTAFFHLYDNQKITIKSFFKEEIPYFKTFIENLRPLICNDTMIMEITDTKPRTMHSNYFLLLTEFPEMIPDLKCLIVQTQINFELETLIKNAKATKDVYFNDIKQDESALCFLKQANDLGCLRFLNNGNLTKACKIFVIYTVLTSRYYVLDTRNDMKTALKLNHESAELIEFIAENYITNNGFNSMDEAREQLINISMFETDFEYHGEKYNLETIDDNSLLNIIKSEIDYHRQRDLDTLSMF